jgi:hypothetical protein
LRDHEEELNALNVKIVVVTFENDYFARLYVQDTALTWPLLIDESRETFRKYGMLAASFWDIWGPKTWMVYLREIRKGKKLVKSEGDIYQRGGDVLIDPDGIVQLHHVGEGPADRPDVESILQAIRMRS